ncbi:LysR family transcriptional regulator [Roseivivax isoporae]|uniref:helix-turn-helix domain-containing protein n=1 Tax=Roseivivax isoporae TaxID=591206 RepID=UPI003138023A
MDRLQSLKVFVATADTGSFADGARALGISAPSATRGVGELERALGARLFADHATGASVGYRTRLPRRGSRDSLTYCSG